MNLNRTHGLLTSPFVSKMIAETLMNKIDQELEASELSFVRFMDDYEVFIFDDTEVDLIIKKVQEALYQYGFGLNSEKTKYVEFPYVDKKDLAPIFDSAKDSLNSFCGYLMER
jgi:hypothetical protein